MTKTVTTCHNWELRAKFLGYHAEIGFIYCEQPMVLIEASKSRSCQSQDHLKVKIILKSRVFQIKSVNLYLNFYPKVGG